MELVRDSEAGELDLEDPQLEEKLVNELKAQGVFDQFRKDCLSDVDTKPAYQNLRVRVDKSVSSYLSKTTWRPTLNKNQLRNQLRKYIQEMSGVEAGVDRIVDQIVNPKLNTSFMPEVENVIYKYFGTSKPEEGDDMVNGNNIDDDDDYQNLQNGDSNHDMGGKISTRNLSTISSDAEMLNFDANSMGSSPGPGLAGNVSPLTPGGSPKVNQGDISPLTPSTTPPPPPGSDTEPQNMELSQSHEEPPYTTPPPMQMETPPPPPPGEELKVEEIVTMEVDSEELSRPQSAYTPPLPPTNNTHHSTPEKSYTPPLPMMIPPRPPTHQPSGPSSPHTPPLPPLPREVVGDDSGGEASMSSISDTDLGDISPPRQRKQSGVSEKKDGDTASDISEEEFRPESGAGQSKDRDSDNVTPDEDLQQLEKMKAELMAQLEGDFKLSPEDSDSEGEQAEDVRGFKESPASPDHSASSRSDTPAAKQASPLSGTSPPNQLLKMRNLPLPSPEYSTMTPVQRIKSLPLPGQQSSERARSHSGPGTPEEVRKGPRSPDQFGSGPRSPSLSPSPPPPRRGPQTPPSPPSAFSARPSVSDSSPPQESLSKLDLNDPQTVTPTCKPFSSEGPKSPGSDGDLGGSSGPAPPSQAPLPGGTSSSQEGSRSTTAPAESSDQKTPVNKSSHSHSSFKSHHSSKHHSSSSSRDKKSEKKLDKIKEQTKAKIEKYEQKIKSKDKLKSDKFQDMDIFSTTRKPATPYPKSRIPKLGSSGASTPVTSKPQNDFEKKLAESIRKEVERREEEKERRRKEEEKNNSFKKPVKIEDMRRSSSGEKIKERRSSKDDKKDCSKSKDRDRDRHEKERKDRKSSSDKERRNSEDEKKEPKERDSKYEKEREKQAMESKKRLQEAREKKEKEEKEKRRQKDKERREKEKKTKENDKVKEEKDRKESDKSKDRSKSETKDIIKEKISSLGVDNIQKMLMESLAEKTGAKFSEDEKKDMIKKLEGLIKKKKDAKQSPKKIVDFDSSEDDTPVKKVSPSKKNKIEDSSDSSLSDSDFNSDGDERIKDLRNRVQERKKSGESDKAGGQSPKRSRPVRNRKIKTFNVESEQSDTNDDFVMKEEILEKAPTAPKAPRKSVETKVKVEPQTVKVEPKVETKAKPQPLKKSAPKAQPIVKKIDIDPEIEDLSAFAQSDVDFMLSIKEKYDTLLQDEDALSVSSVSSEELNAVIPATRTVVIDAGPDPEETVKIMKQFGGNPRLFTPVPEWLHPYLRGAKVKVEDVGMPTKEEISEYIQNKQTKTKKRGGGWDIVVEWVPTGPPQAKKSKLEKQLGFDMDSSFGQTVAMSGSKRTRRANMKYSDTEFTSEEDPASKASLLETNLAPAPSNAPTVSNLEQEQPNAASIQPSNKVRTHLGSSQTPKRGVKGRKDSLLVRRVEPSVSKEEPMDIETGEDKVTISEEKSEVVKDSPDSPPAAEDRAEVIHAVEDNTSPVSGEEVTPASEDNSPGKKRRSKDIIAAYLTSAGVGRADQAVIEDKVDIPDVNNQIVSDAMGAVENEVDISSNSIIAVADAEGDKEAVVALLDAEISAADEELNSLIRNLKRKRSSSGDTKFHGWAVNNITVPKTAFSNMLEAAESDLAQPETIGASFGMTDIDLLLSSEDEDSLLEVVMSLPILRDIKKVESLAVPSVVGVKPIETLVEGKDEGSKGKHTDSDSDERVLFRSS
eukprot:GFUD01104848.1.p1 GENE.GFUD01104848.1~~GFUD01104848.1.p1  ORF type:complete len:1707 (+),score=593.92 GFUD01104848.1:349-5469(+)